MARQPRFLVVGAGDARTRGSQARLSPHVVPAGEYLEPAGVVGLVDVDRRRGRCAHWKDDDLCGLTVDGERCAGCLRRERKRLQKEFIGERAPRLHQTAFRAWHLPHHGKEHADCGRATFFAHDHAAGAHYWLYNLPCKRRSCTKCAPVFNDPRCDRDGCQHRPCKAGAWESRIARQWDSELTWWRKTEEAHAIAIDTNQRFVPVVHVIVSVPPKAWDDLRPEEKTRDALGHVRSNSHIRVQKAGLVGGYWAMHGVRVPSRWNDRTCSEDGLHFHYIGVTNRKFGLVDGQYVRRLHARKGWVIKRLPGWRKQPFQTMLYQLSHATWPEFNDGLEDQDAAEDALYPASKHNSDFGRSCGRIGTFLGLAGLAPPAPEPEDLCPVCEENVAPSQRFEVYRLADAPPPAPFGVIDWSHWSDAPVQALPPSTPPTDVPERCGCGRRTRLKNCFGCAAWHCENCASGSSSCAWNQ